MQVADIAGGLRLDVDSAKPGLVLESSRFARLRLSAGSEPLMWAQMQKNYEGIWVVRAKAQQPRVVRPIRSAEARDGRSVEAWMRWFAGELEQGAGPLRRGEWRMSSMRQAEPSLRHGTSARPLDIYFSNGEEGSPAPAYGALKAMDTPRVHFESWIGGGADVLPLRDPSPEDSGRIKSWRKHARDGTLPPVLLWWVGALDAHVVLDGHDRLSAAALEEVAPRLITMSECSEVQVEHDLEAHKAEVLKSYERAFASENLSPQSRRELNERLVRSHKQTYLRTRTSARANPALEAEWMQEMLAAAEDEDVSKLLAACEEQATRMRARAAQE